MIPHHDASQSPSTWRMIRSGSPRQAPRTTPFRRAAIAPIAFGLAVAVACASTADVPSAVGAEEEAQTGRLTLLQVRTSPVLEASSRTIRLHGQITGSDVRTLSFEVGGPIRQVAVERGDVVERGAVLARLDAQSLRNEERAARARSEDVSAQQRRVRQDLDRAQRLQDQGAATAAQVETLESTAAQLEAAQRGIAAELDELARRQRAVVLRAPEGGEVLEVHQRAGSMSAPGQPIVTLRTAGQLVAEVAIPESWLKWVDEGANTALHFPASGHPVQESPVEALLEPSGRSSLTLARIPLADQTGLRAGLRVVAEVEVPGVGFEVPLAALARTPSPTVWVVDAGSVVPVAVSMEEVRATTAVVAGDLHAGDRVAVSRLDRLEAGQAVTAMAEGP